MCNDDKVRSVDYKKHFWRGDNWTHAQIDQATTDKNPSLFYPDINYLEIEMEALKQGFYCRQRGNGNFLKAREFAFDIGASEGRPSRWVLLKSTRSEIHAHPITFEQFRGKAHNEVPCCNEVDQHATA